MTSWLLDVNVLIALLDAQHEQASRARSWFHGGRTRSWLSCPLTENGAIRIMASAGYSSPKPLREIVAHLRTLTTFGQHRFIPDGMSLLDEMAFRVDRIGSPKHLTDVYLLGLAARHGAALATFDARIVTDAVRSPDAEVFLIP